MIPCIGNTFLATTLVSGSPLLGASINPDSIAITYHSFIIEDTTAGPNGKGTAWTLCEYPQLKGLADPDTQSKLNEYLQALVRDSSNLSESEAVVLSAREEPVGYDLVKIIMADNTLLSYVKTEVLPGGAHPVTHISSMTIDMTTLQPIPLDSLLTEGYLEAFQFVVKQVIHGPLLDHWLDAVEHQHDGSGIVVTDTAIVLGRDTEWDFHLPHGGREFSEVPIPYRILNETIKVAGPLGRFLK